MQGRMRRIDEFPIYHIYILNLGLGTAVFDWEREQSCFRGSREGANKSTKRAWMSSEQAQKEHMRAQVHGSLIPLLYI